MLSGRTRNPENKMSGIKMSGKNVCAIWMLGTIPPIVIPRVTPIHANRTVAPSGQKKIGYLFEEVGGGEWEIYKYP